MGHQIGTRCANSRERAELLMSRGRRTEDSIVQNMQNSLCIVEDAQKSLCLVEDAQKTSGRQVEDAQKSLSPVEDAEIL